MNRALICLAAALAGCAASAGAAVPLPPSCATVTTPPDTATPIAKLKRKVEALNETDPTAAFALLCTTTPRVAREYGDQSLEAAWWVGSFATPLIAYMDKNAEALPLLEYARPILEKHHGRYGVPLGDIHVAYAWMYFREGKLAESSAEWQEALKVRERNSGPKKIELQKILMGLAQIQIMQRDFPSGERTLGRAQAILRENHETVSEAGAAAENALTNLTFRQERFEEARHHAEETLRIERQLGQSGQLVPGYALLGRILERLDEYEQAEQALRQALALSEGAEGPLQRHHYSALYQLAMLLDERGRPEEARTIALKALAVGETTLGPTAPRLVPTLQVLGNAERKLGALPDAVRRFERAGAIIEADAANVERPWRVDYFGDLGELQLSLGDAALAETTLARGLDAVGNDPTLTLARAHLLVDHAHLAAAAGHPEARAELTEAATLLHARLPDSHPAVLRVVNELCALELADPAGEAADCADAERRVERATDIEPALRSAVYGNQSRLAAARGDDALAHRAAVRALAAAESAGTPDPLWQAYFQAAEVIGARNDGALAIFFGKQSIAQIERERGYFVGEDRRFDRVFLRDKVVVYRRVADWLMEAGRIDEGLAVLKLMKTEELAGFGVREAVAGAGDRGVELTGEERQLRDRYAATLEADRAAGEELSHLGALEEAGRISPAERVRLRELLAGRSQGDLDRAERIEALLANRPDAAPVARARTLDAPALRDIARGFGPDAAFAVYLLSDQHLRVLVTARGQQQEFRIPVDATELKRSIGRLLDDIARRADVTDELRALYAIVARPVDEFAARVHARRLVLWLDGPLRYLPAAALEDGHRYLGDKYPIQLYAPAADAGTTRLASVHPEVRGLGVTRAIGGFTALPAVADELCYVVRGPIEGLATPNAACPTPSMGNGALSGEGFLDAAFTETRLRSLLAAPHDFAVLHVGTHFRLRPGNALRSFLLLGDGARLTLDAIGGLDFTGIDVVTLSACETGMGGARTDDGREVEGLSALVERRGAGHVIASLWQVEDVSTAQLMRALYTSFSASHGDAAAGLQQAQRSVRAARGPHGESFANPYYWAGFTLSGSRP